MFQVSGMEVVRALERAGWIRMRSAGGSHVKLMRVNGSGRVVVPVHGSASLKPGTLKRILDMTGLTEDELKELL